MSDSLRCQECRPARALALAHAQQHVRPDHGQVREFRELRHSGVGRALIPVTGRVRLLARGRFAMVSGIAQESDRDTELDPFSEPARNKTPGAVLRSESRTSEWIFDSDVLAHGYRKSQRSGCGYTRKGTAEERGCGSFERPARLWENA